MLEMKITSAVNGFMKFVLDQTQLQNSWEKKGPAHFQGKQQRSGHSMHPP